MQTKEQIREAWETLNEAIHNAENHIDMDSVSDRTLNRIEARQVKHIRNLQDIGVYLGCIS